MQCWPRANLLASSATTSGKGSRSPPGPGAWALPRVRQHPQDSVLQDTARAPASTFSREEKTLKKLISFSLGASTELCLPLLTPYFWDKQEKELPIRSLTVHGPPQVTNPCLWLLHSHIRPLLVQGFQQKYWWLKVLGSTFEHMLQPAAKHKAERHWKSKQFIWNCSQHKLVSAAS